MPRDAALLPLHIANGRHEARRIIAHPDQHGAQRRIVAWLALGATWDRLRRTAEPQSNLGAAVASPEWPMSATVIEAAPRALAADVGEGGDAA